jgi:hypothetical protein
LAALRLLAHALYFLAVASIILLPRPLFLGRWGWEMTLLWAFAAGLLFRPFRVWLDLITTTKTLRFPGGRPVPLRRRHRLAFLVGGLLLVLVPCEVAFRLNRRTEGPGREEFNPFLQIRLRPGDERVHVNTHGFRGEEITKNKPAGVFRAFFMGGSTVHCPAVAWEKSHVRLLERKLRAAYPDRRIEVMNAGVPWYTSEHTLINYLFHVREFEPDLVIFMHAINDLVRSFSPSRFAYGPYRDDYSHYFGAVSRVVFRARPADRHDGPGAGGLVGHIASSLADRYAHTDAVAVAIDHFASLGAFARNVAAFAQRLRTDGVHLVLCTQPSLYRPDLDDEGRTRALRYRDFCEEAGKYPDLESMTRAMRLYNAKIKEIATRQGVPLLDLEGAVPKTVEYFRDDCHYTEAGNRRVAETTFAFLRESRLLD